MTQNLCGTNKPDWEHLYREAVERERKMRDTILKMSDKLSNPPLCVQNIDFKERYERAYMELMKMSSETLMQRLRRWWNDRKVM